MKLDQFMEDAGRLISYGLNSRENMPAEVKDALKRVYSSIESEDAFKSMTLRMGLIPILSSTRTMFTLVPSDTSSPFSMKVGDVRKNLGRSKDDAKIEILGFFLLSVIATFFPTRESITHNSANAISEKDIFVTVEKMVDFARQDVSPASGQERALILAERVAEMQERKDGDGRDARFRDFYVKAALNILLEHKQITEKRGSAGEERTYLPTPILRQIILERLTADTLQMAAILKRYHARQTPATMS